jgi:hypothetical protein
MSMPLAQETRTGARGRTSRKHGVERLGRHRDKGDVGVDLRVAVTRMLSGRR